MFARHRSELTNWHYLVFLGGLLVMLIHLSEDALVHKENGSSLAAQLGSTALTVVLVAVGALLYPLVWRRARPLFVLAFGVLAFLGGWRAHATDLLDGNAAGGDYTGTVYALAGLVLIVLALKLGVDAVRDRAAPTHQRDYDSVPR